MFQNSELFRFQKDDREQNFILKHFNIYAAKCMNIHIAYKMGVQVNSATKWIQVKSGIIDKWLQQNFCLQVLLGIEIMNE